jgi:3-methyladenine DNA glycosylase AlkD
MKRPIDAERLIHELRSRLALVPTPTTAAVRSIRREFSRRIVDTAPGVILQLALRLVNEEPQGSRFVAYEIVRHHKSTFEVLSTQDLLRLGRGLNSWSSVDCFAIYLSGPSWAQDRVSDRTIAGWARSEDRWWRRAALVSTVALSRRGDVHDIRRVVRICGLLSEDRDDMVVKALSWAVRELAKKHPLQARSFIAQHRRVLAARVIREVENKLTTALKTPRRPGKARAR